LLTGVANRHEREISVSGLKFTMEGPQYKTNQARAYKMQRWEGTGIRIASWIDYFFVKTRERVQSELDRKSFQV
jgi:hypothetical protein